jgi:hypothetical protein
VIFPGGSGWFFQTLVFVIENSCRKIPLRRYSRCVRTWEVSFHYKESIRVRGFGIEAPGILMLHGRGMRLL